MKRSMAVLVFTVSFFSMFSKAETCSPESTVENLLKKQRSISGGQFYVTSPIIKNASSGQVYEFQFSSIFSDGSGEIGAIEVEMTTCKLAKFSVVSTVLVKE